MRYLSVCAGIEAATCAWHPLGWTPAAFSEIEAFPRAVLAHHYPAVPLHGDFTTIEGREYGAIDLLVGGTPCQDFSVAGLRAGIAGDRGNLTLEFLRLASRARPVWIVWENVPGVLSSDGGRALGAFLGGLGELGYGFAYRVLDAQYFGLAQRRARVFVVGYLGDWRRAAAVLFERESLLGDHPPRREAGKGITPVLAAGAHGSNGAGIGRPGDPAFTLDTTGAAAIETVGALCADTHPGAYSGQDAYTGRLIAFSVKDHGGDAGPISPTLRSGGHDKSHANGGVMPAVAFAIQERAVSENPASGPDGIGVRGDGMAYTLEARTVPQAVAFEWQRGSTQRLDMHENFSPALIKSQTPAVAFDLRGRDGGAAFEGPHDTANIRAASGGSSRSYVAASAVRRLTPRECERLQGFPDDYTLVPYRKKPAADGPRYKALGNSMAVPVMAHIGRRIAAISREV